ncbi:BamA/TamA family outer membrane protein [Sulfitobacter sp. SK012]|uniref:BamA/TamA family outer membrane protein n=1 Tax=Sulfitobacter sp. SK012 TaxID=1389005 RepID=UPI0020C76EE3|nr:BamA/TamA family outer membrane protein [Sulfitobacter sp. SK012]
MKMKSVTCDETGMTGPQWNDSIRPDQRVSYLEALPGCETPAVSEKKRRVTYRSFVQAAAIVGFSSLFIPQAATANPNIVDNRFNSVKSVQEKSDYGLRNGSFIVVPVPFTNPIVGAGLAIGGGYLFQLDPEAETSFIGLGGMASDNNSSAYGVAINLSFGSGSSFNFALAEADLLYDLFVGPVEVPINQDGVLLNSGFDYGLTDTISVGAAVRYLDTTISLQTAGASIPADLIPDLGLELLSLGGKFEWDIRDDSDYPTGGARLNVAANFGTSLSGPSRDYLYASANFDAYHSLSETTVVAGRLSTCGASSNAPFFDKCSIGFSDGFRGFSPTQFYNTRLLSAQAEIRQRLGKRFGVVAFGGFGWTGPSFGSLTDNGLRAAGGLGVRYRVSQKFPIDFSVDMSMNNDSEDFLYIYVGQRF